MPPILTIRPEPGANATARLFREAGFSCHAFPLFAIEPVAADAPHGHHDAILIGSANAVRHGGEALAAVRHLPVYAVGGRTAELAEQIGLTVAATGTGGLEALLPALERDGRRHVLRLSGERHVALPDVAGLRVDTLLVYRSAARALPEAARTLLAGPAIVLLHSAAAAEHFAAETARLGIDRAQLRLATFAPAVSEAAGGGWGGVHHAETPSDKALLALVRQLCQKPA